MLVMLLVLSGTMLTVVGFALAAGLGADPAVSQRRVVFTVLFTVLGGIEIWLLGPGASPVGRRQWVVAATWMVAGHEITGLQSRVVPRSGAAVG